MTSHAQLVAEELEVRLVTKVESSTRPRLAPYAHKRSACS